MGLAEALGLIGAGVALLAVFVVIEGRFAHAPLMPLRIFASRTLSAANIVVMLMGGATFGMWFFLSLYLQQVLGYSPIKTGLAFLPMTVCIVLGSALASRAVIRDRRWPRCCSPGMAALTVGLVLLKDVSVDGTYVGVMLAPSLLVADRRIGLRQFVPGDILAVSGVDSAEAGLASGLVNTARLFGGALGLAILAAIATAKTNAVLSSGGHSLHAALTSGFELAFIVAAGFALVGGLVALVGLPRFAQRGLEHSTGQHAVVESSF